MSSDDSLPDARQLVNGASGSRIVRRPPPSPEKPPSSASGEGNSDEGRFTRFRLTHIEHDTDHVRAAWEEAAGDVPKASALLNDPSWKPPPKTPPRKDMDSVVETGRVKEVVEANKAQRLAVKEKGKKSMIYRSRVVSDGKPISDVPGTPQARKPSPMVIDSPMSPDVAPRKRLKRKVVASDSEGEYADSDKDSEDDAERTSLDQQRALDYFNETSAEGLQELTGASIRLWHVSAC